MRTLAIDKRLQRLHQDLTRLTVIPEEEWQYFASLLKLRTCLKGDLIARQGENFPFVGYVLQGIFRYYYTTKAGDEVIKAFATEGMLVSPYASLLQGLPSHVSIQALEDTSFYAISYADHVALYQRHPCWQELGRKNVELLFIIKERRERQLLMLDAAARLAEFQEDYPGLAARIPQYHVAAYLGINPVTLSRIITKQG